MPTGLWFWQVQEIWPKDHERTRRAGVGSVDYNLNLIVDPEITIKIKMRDVLTVYDVQT